MPHRLWYKRWHIGWPAPPSPSLPSFTYSPSMTWSDAPISIDPIITDNVFIGKYVALLFSTMPLSDTDQSLCRSINRCTQETWNNPHSFSLHRVLIHRPQPPHYTRARLRVRRSPYTSTSGMQFHSIRFGPRGKGFSALCYGRLEKPHCCLCLP